MKRGADIHANASPLSHAADEGHIDVVRFLLEIGMDPRMDDDVVFELMNDKDQEDEDVREIMELLNQYSSSPSQEKEESDEEEE